MDQKLICKIMLTALRFEYGQEKSIISLMEKTTDPEILAKMRTEKLDPLLERIADLEEELRELDEEDWWKKESPDGTQ